MQFLLVVLRDGEGGGCGNRVEHELAEGPYLLTYRKTRRLKKDSLNVRLPLTEHIDLVPMTVRVKVGGCTTMKALLSLGPRKRWIMKLDNSNIFFNSIGLIRNEQYKIENKDEILIDQMKFFVIDKKEKYHHNQMIISSITPLVPRDVNDSIKTKPCYVLLKKIDVSKYKKKTEEVNENNYETTIEREDDDEIFGAPTQIYDEKKTEEVTKGKIQENPQVDVSQFETNKIHNDTNVQNDDEIFDAPTQKLEENKIYHRTNIVPEIYKTSIMEEDDDIFNIPTQAYSYW